MSGKHGLARYPEDCSRPNPGPPKTKRGSSNAKAVHKAQARKGVNRFVEGNFWPTARQGSFGVTVTEGKVPEDLVGMFARVGPNPLYDTEGTLYHPFDGDGLIHAVRFDGGSNNKNPLYSKKYIETKKLTMSRARGWDTFPFGEMSHGVLDNMKHMVDEEGQPAGPANTNIITFDNKAYALYESDLPYEFRASTETGTNLETVGRANFEGKLSHPVAAHPKVDYKTNEFMLFGYSMNSSPSFVSYTVLQKGGKLACEMEIPIESPRMMHDMAITATRSLLFDPNYLFHVELAFEGKDPWVNHLDRPARFGVFPRHCSDPSRVKWIDVSACGLFHFANAWDDESNPDIVHVYGCRSRSMRTDEAGAVPYTRMHHWVLDVRNGICVSERFLSNHLCDFPQIDQRLQGYKTRYLYAVEFESDMENVDAQKAFPYFQSVLKFDVDTGKVQRYASMSRAGNKNRLSEAVFAPAAGNSHEDQGYMIAFSHDESTDLSECTILDAKTMTIQARLAIPHRVPYGFHATFIRGEDIQGQGHPTRSKL